MALGPDHTLWEGKEEEKEEEEEEEEEERDERDEADHRHTPAIATLTPAGGCSPPLLYPH